jgi:hypothetical protein
LKLSSLLTEDATDDAVGIIPTGIPEPGFGIFEATTGSVPIPEDEDVEAEEVGLGR